MATERGFVTQSEAKSDPTVDPASDLILNDDLASNVWPKDLSTQQSTRDQLCLMAKVMTPQMFEELSQKKTAEAGWTIARAINTGTMYPDSFVGCHAGDHESYSLFEKFYRPIIESYHTGYKLDGSMHHVTDMDIDKVTTDLAPEATSRVVSTRVRVGRNLSFFPLNPAGSLETRLQIADLMEKVFATLEGDLAGTFFRHTTMTAEQTQQLIDDHLLFRGKDKLQAASGYHQHWPQGRGIFHSASKEFVVWVNEGDHLRIISMQNGSDVKKVFERLGRAITAIETGIKKITGRSEVFMTDPVLGVITCCPSNLGTAMRASVHILVPKIIAAIGFKKLDAMARAMNCQVRGSSGEHSEVVDRVDVSNWRRLGFPEWQLIQDMIQCANKLAGMETQQQS